MKDVRWTQQSGNKAFTGNGRSPGFIACTCPTSNDYWKVVHEVITSFLTGAVYKNEMH